MFQKRGLVIALITSLTYCNILFSQSIPNADFEAWQQDESFLNPVDWGTSNFSVYGIINFNPVFKETTDVYSGNSCVRLETVEDISTGDLVKVAGLITLGTFDIDLSTRKAKVFGGIPFSERPSLFSGYYKYSTSGIDSCIMSIFLTKFNQNTKLSDTIGVGLYTSSNQNDWALFEAPINYSSSDNPDSMNIVILSSDTSIFDTGSTLYVDNISLDNTSNVSWLGIKNNIKVYPNPAYDIITVTLDIENFKYAKYSIINASGQTIKSSSIQSNEEMIDISELNPGIYFIKVNLGYNMPFTKSIIIN